MWLVRAVNSDYAQLHTAVIGDCLMTTSTGFTPFATLHVQVQPNPFSHQTHFVFSNTEHEQVQLTVTDLKGQVLYQSAPTRGNEILLRRDDLAAGVYFYQVKSATKINGGKLVVQ